MLAVTPKKQDIQGDQIQGDIHHPLYTSATFNDMTVSSNSESRKDMNRNKSLEFDLPHSTSYHTILITKRRPKKRLLLWYPTSDSSWTLFLLFYIIVLLLDIGIYSLFLPIYQPTGPSLCCQKCPEVVWGWHFVTLSYWAGIVQTLYVVFAITDLILWRPHKRVRTEFSQLVHQHRDRFFTVLFPIALFVFVAFWGIELPFEIQRGTVAEWHANDWLAVIGLRGVPCITVFIEIVLVPHRYGKTAREIVAEVFILYVFSVLYFLFNFWAASHNNCWPYAFQAELKNTWERVVAYPLALVVVVLFYGIGRFLNRRWWMKRGGSSDELSEGALDDSHLLSTDFLDSFITE